MADICKKMCTFALEFIGKVSSHRRKSPKIPSIPKPRNRATHLLVGCRSALDKGVWRYLFEWRGRWLTFPYMNIPEESHGNIIRRKSPNEKNLLCFYCCHHGIHGWLRSVTNYS